MVVFYGSILIMKKSLTDTAVGFITFLVVLNLFFIFSIKLLISVF